MLYHARMRRSKTGIVRIKRDTYNTIHGRSVKSGWWELRRKVWLRDKGLCIQCLRKGRTVKGQDVHHIVSLTRGGTSTMGNLITLCEPCHKQRHSHMR